MKEKSGLVVATPEIEKSGFFNGLIFFLFLVILPFATLYLAFFNVQKNLELHQEQVALEEMAEITAHMTRLANHETYFQDRFRRLADSFRWASSTNDISSPIYGEAIELYLFDHKGKRIKWAGGTKGKIRISESYLELLVKLHNDKSRLLSRREQSLAASFSGNASTLYSMNKSPETLMNFQGLGLRKLGAWFRPKLHNLEIAHLLVFLNPDKINKHHLAERAIRKIQRFAGSNFRFAWIDLNTPKFSSCTGNKKFKEEGQTLLSQTGLKSGFKFENNLFSLNDTPEGIRLLCFRSLPTPPGVMENYLNILRTMVPVMFLFLIWKTVFRVKLDLSVSLQFSLIFGYTALMGILILLSGISAFQNEKQTSLIAAHKHQAIQILEKIDRNFSASYGDLLRQYRYFTRGLNQADANPKEILQPLQKAQAEEKIAFASFSDNTGTFLFRAPEIPEDGNTTVFEVKYANLINSVSSQIIRTFNSSRQPGNSPGTDVIGVRALSARPIEGLLQNRSTLQNIVFDGDETMTFMDLAINASNTANGCLFIVHEPRKLEKKYLSTSGTNISRSTGFQLVAFPKKHSDKSSYFPRYSMTRELPLWKLQDLVNQTQVSSFKIGRIDNKEVLVAATPGHNLRNFNLFLIIPMEPIRNEAKNLTLLFIASALLAIIFIAFLSGMLVRSLITPISHLAACAGALTSKSATKIESIIVPEGNELENISTGLADLIIKVREFNEGRSIKRHLLPPKPLHNGAIVCDGFQVSSSNEEREIYHFAALNENQSLVFLMRTDLAGIEGSLHLSMARMAARLISEELNVNSSYRILKDLEEYFRINLRRKLGGDFFLGIIDQEAKTLSYAGCGGILLYLVNHEKNAIDCYSLPQAGLGSTEFHSQGSTDLPFTEKMQAFIISPAFTPSCQEKLRSILPGLVNTDAEQIKQALQSEAEKACSQGFSDSASFLLAQRSSEGTEA